MPMDLPQSQSQSPTTQSPVLAAQGNNQSQTYTHRRTHSSTRDTSRPNSPLKKVQLWAEEYHADRLSGESNRTSIDESIPLPPHPTPTLPSRSFSRNLPLQSDEESTSSRTSHTHQRSNTLTQLLPFGSAPRRNSQLSIASTASPSKEEIEWEYMASFTGDKDRQTKVADKAKGGIGSWFGGSSAPAATGAPAPDQEEKTSKMASRDPSPHPKLERKRTLPVLEVNNAPPPKPSGSSVFHFFSPKHSPKTVQLPAELNADEYLTLDIQASLFPSGQVDPFSPAAFKNLLANAEGLLQKLQTAYKLRTIEYHELRAEKEAQAEELEEAEMRAKHLKLQLQDMVKKMNEQDTAIEDMVMQLATEKQTRVEESERIEKRIQEFVARNEEEKRASCCSGLGVVGGDDELGIAKSKWRKSAGSGSTSTDLSESDADQDADDDAASGGGESVFSRSRSPTLTVSTVMTRDSTPDVPQVTVFGGGARQREKMDVTSNPIVKKPQASALQKILGRATGGSAGVVGGIETGCANCRGQGASMAWDTVGLLRVENKGLKDRVGELEVAVEGALDLCGGLFVPSRGALGLGLGVAVGES
ncbi:chromosome segregation SMC common bacterial type protein [Rutstroemia sp. NJR-2017a BVV2]|nr:chromosome segregation SMC common bacterial type protein [Rutstroemia sp. NJR-2017a BVV2]